MKRIMMMAITALLVAGNAFAVRELDYAAEDAGYEIIKAISHRQLSVGKIAFLPLFGDNANLTSVIRAEITRYPGTYEFYVREDEDWNKLVGEIEFGVRKSDIMDQTTIQKFGQIKGVGALLYGDVREAVVEDGKGIVRLTMKLADVKTGQVLWSASVEGRYVGELKAPDRRIAEVVSDAAEKAAQSLAEHKSKFGRLNIYLMPMNAGNVRLSDYVLPEFTKISDPNIRFFSGVAQQSGRRIVNKMAAELSSSGIVISDLNRISKQLDQLFEGGESTGEEQVRDAILYGHFGEISADQVVMATAVLNFHLADLVTGEELWGETVEGRVPFDWIYVLQTYWKQILIGVVVLIVLIAFIKMTRRPR